VAAVVPSTEQARELMRRGVVDGVVILPERFEADLARGSADGIAVWLNGGYLVRVTSIG
jgi:ABC-2 type transport system permease protein